MQRLLSMLVLSLVLSSCAYTPVTHAYSRWVADVCGRKSFVQRLCGTTVSFFLLPVYLVTFAIDIPFGIIEIIFGYKPLKDPVLTGDRQSFREYRVAGERPSHYWTVRQLDDRPGSFLVRVFDKDTLIEELIMVPQTNGLLGIYVEARTRTARALVKHVHQDVLNL